MRILPTLLFAALLLPLAEVRGQGLPNSPSSYYQRPSAATAAYAVQPASASEPLPPAGERAPIKLAPRSHASHGALAKPVAPTATSAIGTVAGSLGIVLGLFFVVVWFSRRFSPPGSTQLPKEAVETLGRAPFSSKQQLQLLRVGNKLLLVAHSPSGVETLTEITDATEVEHLTALCRRGQSGSSSAAFRQVLNQIAAEPAPGGFVGQTRRETSTHRETQPHRETRGAR